MNGSYFDPDHWVNGGEHDFSDPVAKAFAELEDVNTVLKRQLRDAMKLLQTAESGLIGTAHTIWEQRREELKHEVKQ